MSFHLPPADPLKMSRRARAYLIVGCLRHLWLGSVCLGRPDLFANPAYNGIKNAMPGPPDSDMLRWGLLFLATGFMCGLAAARGQEGLARWALLASVASTAILAGGFLVVSLHGIAAPTGLIGYLALTAKDLVVLRQPLRSPFEALARRVLAEPGR